MPRYWRRLRLYRPRGVCKGCPFARRCHAARQQVIDTGIPLRTSCPFYRSYQPTWREPAEWLRHHITNLWRRMRG